MSGTTFRELTEPEMTTDLFRRFNRYQEVSRCWRKVGGDWVIKNAAFTEQWNAGDYKRLLFSLTNTLRKGGTVLGAFRDGALVGFASVENTLFGARGDYLELSYFHVTYELRGRGIGRRLFALACQSARQKGAAKLYISAHSSVETQAFYRALGCVEAAEPDESFSQREPCDVQMEVAL